MELNALDWVCIAFGVASILWMSIRQDRIRSLKEALNNVIQAKVGMTEAKEAAVAEAQKWSLKHGELLKVNASRLEEIACRDAELAAIKPKYHDALEAKLELQKIADRQAADLVKLQSKPQVKVSKARKPANVAVKPKKVAVRTPKKPKEAN